MERSGGTPDELFDWPRVALDFGDLDFLLLSFKSFFFLNASSWPR